MVYTIKRIRWLMDMLQIGRRFIARELDISLSSLQNYLNGKTIRHRRMFEIACTNVLNTYMDALGIYHGFDPLNGVQLTVEVAGIKCACPY